MTVSNEPKYECGSYLWGNIKRIDYIDNSGFHYEIMRKGEKYSYWVEESYIDSLNNKTV